MTPGLPSRLGLVLGLALVSASCDSDGGVFKDSGEPDDRLVVHALESSAPSTEGAAYARAVTRVHERAGGAASTAERIAILHEGLAIPVPAGFAEGQVLRLELATALCETLAARPEDVPAALEVLEPMLRPERSLPLDRVTARALVTLGDTARAGGDDALAAGSYARAIRVMSMLQQEMVP